jgi:phospholipid/cholesterol/gamma-HCH transport system substrate-binding protein
VKFKNTVDNLEKVSASLAGYMSRNEGKLDKTVENFYQASRELNRLLTDNSASVDSSLRRIDRMSRNLESFVIRLDTLSFQIREFAESLNNPDGTLNLLINDRRLYDDLRRTADNIDDLVADIRANPRKYINLKLELF